MTRISLNVNGVDTQVDAPDDMPLLWALRDLIGLTGSKYGCGIGQCGACTVHLNGAPVRSCLVPVSQVSGQAITTIEGLTEDGALHALQQACGKRVRTERCSGAKSPGLGSGTCSCIMRIASDAT